jgi:hypothetical protein
MPFFKVKQTQGAIKSSFKRRDACINIINRIELAILKKNKA